MENAIAAITDTEAAVGGDIDLLQTVPDAPELSGVSTSASDLLNTPEPVEYIIQEINLPQTLISSDIASDEPVNESEAIAQTDDEGSEEASGEGGLAAASQNPVGNLISVPLQNNVNFGVGEFDRTSYTLNIEPVIPTPLSDSLSLVNRAIIPVSYQPELARIPLPNGDVASIGDEFGLGDIAYQAYFVPKPSGNLTIGAGPFFLFPSATDDVLGTGKWGIGPTFAAVYSEGPVVAAILIDNLWSYAGDDDRSDISLMTIEPGINYNLDDGWSLYFGTGNGITANWLAEEGEKWTIPIGAGFGRVFPIGNQPVSMNLRGFWNAEKPEGAADWTLQLTVSLLFPE